MALGKFHPNSRQNFTTPLAEKNGETNHSTLWQGGCSDQRIPRESSQRGFVVERCFSGFLEGIFQGLLSEEKASEMGSLKSSEERSYLLENWIFVPVPAGRRFSRFFPAWFWIPPCFIDPLMGLFRGAVFRHGGGAPKQPIKQPTETPSTMALMCYFPSLMGRFPSLMGRFPNFVLRGRFAS